MTLEDYFKENHKVAIGFSGGVDSSYLLYAAKKYGAIVRPYYMKTLFQPEFEYEDAKKIAELLDVEMVTLTCDILSDSKVAQNPADRCYYCKKTLFSHVANQAKKDGFSVIIDGTNASDEVDDRPGMKALQELQVESPLRMCGLTKDKIRELSKEAGLFTWNKPAYACLATRVPTGEEISKEVLYKVEQAEAALMEIGFTDFRARVFHGAAKLQFTKEQFQMAIQKREEIREKLSPFFEDIFLDTKIR